MQKKSLMSQPEKMLISSFKLQNGTLITPPLLFYLELGLVFTKKYCIVGYTPKKCFNKFIQSTADGRQQSDENPNSGVFAETGKLLANSSYGYQIMGCIRHTVTKYLSDEKTHCAINSKFFKKVDHMNHQLYEVELAKAEVKHKEPVVLGFFFLQYAKLRMLELCYNFCDKFCDINKIEELEMDTDFLYFALVEQQLADCIRPEMKAERENMRSSDCDDRFKADASGNFFPGNCCAKHNKHDKRENRVSSKKNSSVRENFVFVVKRIAAIKLPLTS